MAWYYQTSPHDTHDWDSAQTPILVDGEFNGQTRKLVLHASRNGYYFTLDRAHRRAPGHRQVLRHGELGEGLEREGPAGPRSGEGSTGSAYGGVSNPIYGTLTIGRQQSLELDAVSSYDPMGQAPGLDLAGYSGGTSGGIGSTETARWDNSVKYVFSYGPAHAAAMYTAGGQTQPSSTAHMG